MLRTEAKWAVLRGEFANTEAARKRFDIVRPRSLHQWDEVEPNNGKPLTIEQLKELQHLYESDPILRLLLAIELSADGLLDEASELFNDTCIITPVQMAVDTNGQWSDLKAPISTVVHPNVGCDACKMLPIHGYRYKCTKCAYFDLCGRCYKNREMLHDHHNFMKIPSRKLSQEKGVREEADLPIE